MNTTHIVRIPGKFNLPAGWPKVEVADTLTGLIAHHSAKDLAHLGDTGLINNWPSRTGVGNLIEASPTPPNWRDWGANVSASFNQSQANWMRSADLLKPYTGPVTIATVFRYSIPSPVVSDRQRVVNTRGEAPEFCSISAFGSTGRVTIETQGTGSIFADMPISTPCAVVAVFNGAQSSITINGVTTTGALDAAPGAVGGIQLGSNSSGGQTLNGRLYENRIYARAFTTAEIQALTAELRAEHSI